MNTSQMW